MPTMVAAAQSGGSSLPLLMLLLPFVLIALMFFSQRKRAQAAARAQAALRVGDEVRTTSGMYGTLRDLDEASGSVEVAPGTIVRFDRRALLPVDIDPAAGKSDTQGSTPAGQREGDVR